MSSIEYEVGEEGNGTATNTGTVTPPNLDIDPTLHIDGSKKIWIRVKYKSSGVHGGNTISTESEWSDKWIFQRPVLEIENIKTNISYIGKDGSNKKQYKIVTEHPVFKSPYKEKIQNLQVTNTKWLVYKKEDNTLVTTVTKSGDEGTVGVFGIALDDVLLDEMEYKIKSVIETSYKIPLISGLTNATKTFESEIVYKPSVFKIQKPILSVAESITYGPVLRSPYNAIAGWTGPLTKVVVTVKNEDTCTTPQTITLTGNDLKQNEFKIPSKINNLELIHSNAKIHVTAVYYSNVGSNEARSDISDELVFTVPTYEIKPTDTSVTEITSSQPLVTFSPVTTTGGLKEYYSPLVDVSTHIKVKDTTTSTVILDNIIPNVKDEWRIPLGTLTAGHVYNISAKRKFVLKDFNNNEPLETGFGAVGSFTAPEIEFIAQPTITTPANPYYGKLTISPYQRLNNWPLVRTSAVYHYEDENGTPDGPVIGQPSYKSDGVPSNAYYAYTRLTLPKFGTTYCLTGWLNMSTNVRTLKAHAYHTTEPFAKANVEGGITAGYAGGGPVNKEGDPLSKSSDGFNSASGTYYKGVLRFGNSVAEADDYMHEVEKFVTFDPVATTWPGETVMAEVSKKKYHFHIPYYTIKNSNGETLNWVLTKPSVTIYFKNGETLTKRFW